MSSNPYEDFKQGIKDDVRSTAINLFGFIAVIMLLIAFIVVFVVVFSKQSDTSTSTKIIAGITMIAFVLIMVFNRRIANLILRGWMIILLIVVTLAICGFLGYIAYLFFKEGFKDLF